jgi:tetratricopeptide (TPR) repeat protein
MRNYFLIFIFVSLLLLPSLLLSACGGASDANSNANSNANAQPAMPQYADAKTAYDEGSKFFESGKEVLAIDAFKQAVAFDPDMADAHFKLAMAYSLQEKDSDAEKSFGAAVDAYKKIIKGDPENSQAYFNLGRAYNKLNKDDDSEEALQRAVKLKPDDSSYNYELAAILVKLAQYNEAIKFLKKSMELDPDNTRAEELMEKAEDGKRRVEQGIPANVGGNKAGANTKKPDNSNSNTGTDSNKPANVAVPNTNKKPEVKTTPPKLMEPAKPAAKAPVKPAKPAGKKP